MKKSSTTLAVVLLLLAAGSAMALDLHPWNNHAAPYSFLFGNDIDTHQQTRLLHDGSLAGFFYIQYTAVVTTDHYRVATHVDCNAAPCTVGWVLNAAPRTAAFLYQVDDDHPVFLISRSNIPQPGAFSHFHWLDYMGTLPPIGVNVPGYVMQLVAVDRFCFVHHGANTAASDKSCAGNGGVPVDLGFDVATHLNIVTSFPSGLIRGL